MLEFDTIPAPPAHVLRGPAHADNFRTKVGRFAERWYMDPLPGCDIAPATDAVWPAISTVKKAAGFDAAEFVALKAAAGAFHDNPGFYADGTVDGIYEQLKVANKARRNEAFARGNGVHAACEAILYGHPVKLKEGDPGYNYLPAVQAFFNDYNPKLIAAEFVAIHRDLGGVGYGGTCDAGVTIDNVPTIIDWKSRGEDSNHGAYAEEAAQIAAYMHAQYYLVEGAAGAERRELNWEQGLIVSIKPDSYEVYPID
jgi:hypothetical protein